MKNYNIIVPVFQQIIICHFLSLSEDCIENGFTINYRVILLGKYRVEIFALNDYNKDTPRLGECVHTV